MTARRCLLWPDRRLRTRADSVAAIRPEHHAIWQDMIDTMEAMPGVGLAAVQIGVMERLAVVDASRARGQALRMANPEIIAADATLRAHDEGSPNLPGVQARVLRPDTVTVRFLDETGVWQEKTFEGLWATSVQHQIDHLDGRMFFDRLSRMKRDMLLRKARKVSTA
ncbi:MAG: peptide deformylase [Pseudomonadota bacterium]